MVARPPVRVRALFAVACLTAAPVLAAPAGVNAIHKLDTREEGATTVVTIRGSATPTFTVYKLERPERVVIDVANARMGGDVDGPTAVNTWAVSQLAAQALGGQEAQVVRVLVGFARPSTYRVKAVGNDVVVTVVARDAKPEGASLEAEKLAAAAEQKRADAEKRAAEAERALRDAETRQKAADKKDADTVAMRAELAKRLAEVERTAREAEDKRVAAERLRAEAEARRQAVELKDADAVRRVQEAEQMRAEAADRLSAATKERAAAERLKKDAESSAAAAEQRKTVAAAAAAAAEKRRADADAARATAEKRRDEVDAARLAAEKRRGDAEAAVAAAEKRRGEADTALAGAEAQRAQAETARLLAEKRRAESERTAREAADRARTAEAAGAADATRQRKEAEELAARAEKQRREAEAAAVQAETRRKEADDKRALAETRRKAAESSVERAEARRKEAEDAKGLADAERKRAEAAKASAENERRRAEDAKGAAERERKLAEEAKASAERERQAAEQARDRAQGQRKVAETAQAAAEAARQKEEERVAAVEKTRRAEEQRAEAAGRARVAAEGAVASANEARAQAEQRRADAQAALAAVEDARQRAETAQKEAEGRRQKAEAAARAADVLAQSRSASEAEVRKARAEAARLEKDRQAADADVAARRREVAAGETKAKALETARAQAQAEVAATRDKVDAARKSLADEEKKRADLSAARAAEEKALAEASRRRQDEEKKASAAEARRRETEAAAQKAATEAAALEAAASKAMAAATQKATAEKATAEKATAEKATAEKAALEKAAADKATAEKAAAKLEADKVAAAQSPTAGKTPAPTAVAAARIRDVDYQDLPGLARVVVKLSGALDPRLVSVGDRQAVIDLGRAELPSQLERSLDVREYAGPVAAVKSFRDRTDPGRVRLVVDLTGPASPTLSRAGDAFYIDFVKPAHGRPLQAPPPIVGGYAAATTPVAAQTVGQARAQIHARRIGLTAKDADIHNLLRLIAQAGNVDIIVPDDVKATVTVSLTNVPWREALEVILQAKGLWYREQGNIIRVANRKDLDAEDETERLRLRAMLQEERPETEVIILNYTKAADTRQQLTPLLSPKGKIAVDDRTNSVLVTDVSGNRSNILRLLRTLDSQTPQIQIEARVVEARSTWKRSVGIQWGFNAIASAATGNPTGLVFPSTVAVAGGNDDPNAPTGGVASTTPNFAVNLPAATGLGEGGALGFSFGSLGGTFNVNLRLSAAEDSGVIRIISAPKITVLNGKEATISQGVSIPIQVVSAAGTMTQFVPADLQLKVKPYVSRGDCTINLEVDVTKNEADFANRGARGDPSITRKEAHTTLLIADGDTSVIGGIYTRNTGLSHAKVPWLGDIPIIGFFFKNRSENDDRTEVLIFLTPRITNKASLPCETANERR